MNYPLKTGLQDCWGSEVLQKIERETDNCIVEGDLPASSGKGERYYAGKIIMLV
jgi:hypothetical protein